jgi:hypothetical protein
MGSARVDPFLKKGDRCCSRLGAAAKRGETSTCQRLLTNVAALFPFRGWQGTGANIPQNYCAAKDLSERAGG